MSNTQSVSTEQMREALEKIANWPDGGNRYGQEKIKAFASQVLAALTASAAEVVVKAPVPEAMGDTEARKVLLASDLYDMHKHVGWYSAPEKNFKEKGSALIRSVADARDAQWQAMLNAAPQASALDAGVVRDAWAERENTDNQSEDTQ